MLNNISSALEAFENVLNLIRDIGTRNTDAAVTSNTGLLNVQNFIINAEEIFNDWKEIFEVAKVEVNLDEFKKFQTNLEGVKKEGTELLNDIEDGRYVEIPDDLTKCVEMLKAAVSEASEVTSNFIKIFENGVESVESSILVVENGVESIEELFDVVENVVDSVV